MAKGKKVKMAMEYPLFIEKKPCFDELVAMSENLSTARKMLSALADEDDTCQRATDLYFHIEELYKDAKLLLLQ